jgi:ADP-ribose pyrophosphatase YjhB (NUDIX family)
MVRIHLCTGLLERDGRVLVVANQYPNQPGLLWNLPGGRQEWNETAPITVVRELREETGLEVRVGPLAYVAESFDHTTQTHVTAMCFTIAADGEPVAPAGDAHVRAARFAAYAELPELVRVRVIREPLLGYLDDRRRQYFGFQDAGITIAFADGPAAAPAATPPDADGRAPRPRDARG